MKAVSAAIIVLAGAVVFQTNELFGNMIGLFGFFAWIFFALMKSSDAKE